MFRHILVPMGLGQGSMAAARYAFNLARLLGCRVTLVHIREDSTPMAQEQLQALARQARRPPAVLLIEAQDQNISQVIAEIAQQNQADLIVLSSEMAAKFWGLGLFTVESTPVPLHILPDSPEASQNWLDKTGDKL